MRELIQQVICDYLSQLGYRARFGAVFPGATYRSLFIKLECRELIIYCNSMSTVVIYDISDMLQLNTVGARLDYVDPGFFDQLVSAVESFR